MEDLKRLTGEWERAASKLAGWMRSGKTSPLGLIRLKGILFL
jgi:hypothetical protein